jgi:hypothetical protein
MVADVKYARVSTSIPTAPERKRKGQKKNEKRVENERINGTTKEYNQCKNEFVSVSLLISYFVSQKTS